MARKTGATSGGKRVHVISRKEGWAVKKEENAKASKVYGTKSAAEKGAKRMSKGRDVVVHKRDGSIQKWKRAK